MRRRGMPWSHLGFSYDPYSFPQHWTVKHQEQSVPIHSTYDCLFGATYQFICSTIVHFPVSGS